MAEMLKHPVMASISSPAEIEDLASELADDYIEYFNIDLTQDKKRYEDFIEECLAHLEEVISALDRFKQKDHIVEDFVQKVMGERESLNQLYKQIEEMEQYVIEKNRMLDQMDQSLKDMESQFNSSKIKRIFGFISKGISRLAI